MVEEEAIFQCAEKKLESEMVDKFIIAYSFKSIDCVRKREISQQK